MKLLLGTASGLYVLSMDAAGKRPRIRGPRLGRRAAGPLAHSSAGLLAAVGDTLHISRDGLRWAVHSRLPGHARIWSLASHGDALLAGTTPANLWLWRTDIDADPAGGAWREVTGLRAHPSAAEWWGPLGQPLTQAVISDPRDPSQLYAAVSIAGIFHGPASGAASAEAGPPWSAANEGLPPLYPRASQHSVAHRDAQNLVALPASEADGPLLVAATSHGLYAATPGEPGDPREWWEPCAGEWAWRGVRALTRSPEAGALYAVPLGPDGPPHHPLTHGQLTVYRSRDRARTWEPLSAGLPEEARCLVHRDALAAAPLPDGGAAVFLGTSRGEVYWSPTAGDEWLPLARGLPSIRALLVVPATDGNGEPQAQGWWPFGRG